MNQQKKNMNSQGAPEYVNSVAGADPKYQVRVFNGKPQFRIRKRNDSAKFPVQKTTANFRNHNIANETSSATIDDDDENLTGYGAEFKKAKSLKPTDEVNSHKVIGRLQAKYGITPQHAGAQINNKRKPPNGLNAPVGMKKAYSNSNAQFHESFGNTRGLTEKHTNKLQKKRFSNMNKLPQITHNSILPKI